MKKLVALLLALTMVACLFAGCSKKEEAKTEEPAEDAAATEEKTDDAAAEETTEPAEEEEKKDEEEKPADVVTGTIGFSFPTSNNEFWQIARNYFETACTQLGCEFYSDDCNNDTAEQLTDVETMISKGIDALVLGPQDASVVASVCATCKDAGIPVVIIDRLPGDDVKAGEDYVTFIGPDDSTCGYDQAIALIDSGCTKLVALCGFKGTSVAEGRYEGLKKALEEHPEVELLGEEWCGENMDDGDEAIRNLYSAYPDLDGVWCYNDSLGLAATNVMKEFNSIDKVHVGGMDGLSDAAESIKNGEMYFTCGGHYMMGAMGAVVLFDTMNGVEYNEDTVTRLSLLGINPETADQYIANYIDSNEAIDWTAKSKALNGGEAYDFATMLSFD